MLAVPHRGEQPVGEAQHVQVLGGFLAEEVVDPVDLLLVQDRVDDPVEGCGTTAGEVPNGFSYTTRAFLASPCWPSALVSSSNATGGTAR